MKILHLTLKKKWFDLIASGEKKHEFRESKKHWLDRLIAKDGKPKKFDEIHFRNGYKKDSPSMRVECGEIGFTSPQWFTPKCGEVLWLNTIVICLGKVIEIRE